MSRKKNGDLKGYLPNAHALENTSFLRYGRLHTHPLFREMWDIIHFFEKPERHDANDAKHISRRFMERCRIALLAKDERFFKNVSEILELIPQPKGLPLHLEILEAVGSVADEEDYVESERVNLSPGIDLAELRRRIHLKSPTIIEAVSDDTLRQAVKQLGITLIHCRRGRPPGVQPKFR